jgi:hypothetical protein
MADSRSGLSELSDSGRFLPSQSTSDTNFVCRACGGSEFRVETRRGVVVDLAKLRVFESFALSDRSGHYKIYICTGCEASFQRAHDELRDVLIGKLLFAAKHLAETQFTRRVQHGHADLVCAQCRVAQVDDNRLLHKDDCTVGRVAALLHGLTSLDDPAALAGLQDGEGGLISFPAVAGAENGGVQ